MEKPCYICKEKANIVDNEFAGTQNVECSSSSCGRYKITRPLIFTLPNRQLDPKEVSKIQAWIRENQKELIDTDKLQDILKH